MREETQRLWIVPGEGFEDKGLYDGEAKFFEFVIGARDHGELLKKFCEDYKLGADFCNSHMDYGKFFTANGMILLINAGLIDGKRAAILFLPAQMSEKQLNFLDARREFFKEYYHSNVSFFDIAVLPDADLQYNSPTGFRDLKIESIIDGKRCDDGQELLYREVENQHKKLKGNMEY